MVEGDILFPKLATDTSKVIFCPRVGIPGVKPRDQIWRSEGFAGGVGVGDFVGAGVGVLVGVRTTDGVGVFVGIAVGKGVLVGVGVNEVTVIKKLTLLVSHASSTNTHTLCVPEVEKPPFFVTVIVS